MQQTQFYLLQSKRFLPLFVTQFLGAFNDNVFKNALIILITYQAATLSGWDARILVNIAAGLFILPFFLFSSLAGQIADKYEKSRLIRTIKIIEVCIMIGAAAAFLMSNVYLLLCILFCMGAQSSFFGPLKYSILPQHLNDDELIGGNALIEAGTFLSILLGTILGGLLILMDNGVTYVSGLVILLAVCGYSTSRTIPPAQADQPNLIVNKNLPRETLRIIRTARANKPVFLAILGISWFWFVGATFLAQFAPYAKDVVRGDAHVVTLFLSAFSIGIGIGSLLCNRILKGRITTRYVPLAALCITLFSIDIFIASNNVMIDQDGGLVNVMEFLSHHANWRVLIDLILIAVSGGVYIVPLYAILQSRSDDEHRARMIACNNVMGSLFMVISALVSSLLIAQGVTIPQIFLTIGILNAFVALYIFDIQPNDAIRRIVRCLRPWD